MVGDFARCGWDRPHWWAVIVRGVIRRFDSFLRKRNGVFEFCQAEDCILRLSYSRASHPLCLTGGGVPRGAPVLLLHLWNERIPSIPPNGPDFSWASSTQRMFLHSLQLVAAYLESNLCQQSIQAVGGNTALLKYNDRAGGRRLVQRMGFTVLPYQSSLGSFGEFWENFYAWWLMWAFNPVSLRDRNWLRMRRMEIWMTVDEFKCRFLN
jgi:hypothetical protein